MFEDVRIFSGGIGIVRTAPPAVQAVPAARTPDCGTSGLQTASAAISISPVMK